MAKRTNEIGKLNKSGTGKKAALYIRVSTDAQAEEGYSIDAQEEQLTAYCVSKGIKNPECFTDGGYSGSNIDRPELQRLIREIREGIISHVIVYKLDRLSRSQKDTLYLIEDVFIPNEVSFVSINESIDTASPTGKLMIGILSAFAQLERENIRMRTRMGMKERVKEGYWMGGGRIPFGYDYDREKGILVPNNDAEKVRQIYDLYIGGKSAQDIANMLGLRYDKLVYQILTRKSNYGVIEYNGEEYPGKHEPIISKDIFDMAMDCMNNRKNVKSIKTEHLLTGLVTCGKCGAKMRYIKWGKDGYRLMCYSQQTSKAYLVKDANCDQVKVRAEDVEDAVIAALFEMADNFSKGKVVIPQTIDALSLLEGQRDKVNGKIKRLYNLYVDDGDQNLLETIAELKCQLLDVERKIEIEKNARLVSKGIQENISMLSNIRDLWPTFSYEKKYGIIKRLVKQVKLTGEHIDIEFNV